jgi:predicted nucleic acid-binding Zn ribbon protein
MQPTCITCGRPVEEGRTCCDQCLAEVREKELKFLKAVYELSKLEEVNP